MSSEPEPKSLTIKTTDGQSVFHLSEKPYLTIQFTLPAGDGKTMAYGIDYDATNDDAAKAIYYAIMHCNKFAREKEAARMKHDIDTHERHQAEINRLEKKLNSIVDETMNETWRCFEVVHSTRKLMGSPWITFPLFILFFGLGIVLGASIMGFKL